MDAIDLHPLDVFTVRDGRPFDVGGVVHANAVWPPSPWTILGALRTSLCEVLGVSGVEYGRSGNGDERVRRVIEILGRPDKAPTFQIGPALLARDAEVYWPVPADLVTFTDKEEKDPSENNERKIRSARLRLLRRDGLSELRCTPSIDRELVLLPPDPPEGFQHPDKSPGLKYFDTMQLEAWLAGKPIAAVAATERPLPLGTEPRIGIGMDYEKNTVREGRFYVRYAHALGEALEFNSQYSLQVPVVRPGRDDVPWAGLDGQHLRLGADGHLARIRWRANAISLPEPGSTSGRAALLFLSPVHPDDLRAIDIDGKAATVEAVCANRAISIGGWQLRHDGDRQSGPRRMRRYYPAGTVVYVRSDADLARLHARSIASDPEERAAGFGFCLVGAAPAVED